MSFTYPGFIKDKELLLSHSSLCLFNSCARKFEFRKLLEAIHDDQGLAAEVGTCLHVGYQNYLVYQDVDRAVYEMMLTYPVHLNSNPANHRSIEACYATLMAMIKSNYLLEYTIANVEVKGEIRPAIEVPFKINIKDVTVNINGEEIAVSYYGLIDAILYSHLSDKYSVFDIKTHRRNRNDLTADFIFDEQCLPYGLVLERVLNRPIDKLSVNYLCAYIDVVHPKIQFIPFEKSNIDVQDWAQGFTLSLSNIKTCAEQGWFKRESSSCLSWNRLCGYYDQCKSRNIDYLNDWATMNNSKIKAPKRVRPEPWFEIDLELKAA